MNTIIITQGRHSTQKLRELVFTRFESLLNSAQLGVIQKQELIDFLQYLAITHDLSKKDIEQIINQKTFSGFIPGISTANFKFKKPCSCSSLDYFRNNCRCGATGL